MNRVLKQSTAANLTVLMVQASDHVTGLAGLTLTITASKDGGAFASITPTVTDLGSGWYKLALDTTMTNTLGDLCLHITGTSADPSDLKCHVVAYDFADAVALGLSRLDAAISSRMATFALPTNFSAMSIDASGRVDVGKVGGTAQTARDLGASVLISSGTGTGQLDVTSGVVKSNLSQIIGTAVTETIAGNLAGAFKKLLDVAAPVFTAASINQTGDAFARLGAPAGASVSADIAAVKSDTAAALTRLPAALDANGFIKADVEDWKGATAPAMTGDAFARLGAPAGASVSADVAAVKTDTGNLVSRITSTLFSGITSLAQWLGLMAGKQTGNTTARTEIRATGAGSGTYDETIDSLEAIHGQVAAVPTNPLLTTDVRLNDLDATISSRLAASSYTAPPTVGAIDTQLSGTHGAGAWGAGSSGVGAFTVTIHVTDGVNPVQSAGVRITQGVNNYTASTDASGNAVFSLDAATYTLAIVKQGYTFTPTTIVVTGTATFNETVTAVVIPGAVDPTQSNAYIYTYDIHGTIATGVSIEIKLVRLPTTMNGQAINDAEITVISDGTGLASVNLIRNASYEARRGTGSIARFTVADAATYEMPAILGHP